MRFYTGSTPVAPLDPGTAEFVQGKPAIVEQAKDMRYYRAQLARLDEGMAQNARERRMVVRELKESGAWRSEFKSWKQCCREVLNVSRQRADALIAELIEMEEEDKAQTATPLALSDTKQTLDTVNRLPDPIETPTQRMNRELAESMREPVEEKPRVVARTTDTIISETNLQPKTNGHKVELKPRTEAGKPKNQLAIWREMENDTGRLLNRTDELNRQCPVAIGLHADLIRAYKRCLELLKQWRAMA